MNKLIGIISSHTGELFFNFHVVRKSKHREGEVMAILKPSKLRPAVQKLSEERQPDLVQGLNEFLSLKENQNIDFREIWGKNLEGNRIFFENKKLDDRLRNWLTNDEMKILARFMRFSSEFMAAKDQEKRPFPLEVRIEESGIDGVPVEWHLVPEAHEDRVFLFFHGGGWVLGSPREHRLLSIPIAQATRMKTVSVDYRLAPENPHPAQLEDCVAVYKWLLANGTKPENIIIGGDSAGGHLTLTTLLYLRDNGLPQPAGGVLLAPATDLSLSDESYFTNGETDLILADLGIYWWLGCYTTGADVKDPYVSPLYGGPEGLPPLLFQVSTNEMLYSDTTRFVEKAQKAGVDITLQTWNDTVHVFQFYDPELLPEGKAALDNIGVFAARLFS